MDIKVLRGKGFYKAITYQSPNMKLWTVIHNIKLGPALGGCRMLPINNSSSALRHTALLAKAMTYKNAIVDLPFGGGKTLIYDRNNSVPREKILLEFSDVLNFINGEYFTADDVNTSVCDMDYLRKYAPYARGVLYNGVQIPATAYGVYMAVKAASKKILGSDSLENLNIFIQGLGKVGYNYAKLLRDEKANVYVFDMDAEITKRCIKELGCISSKQTDMFSSKIDILSPCALGNTITRSSVGEVKAKIVAGGANNQLEKRIFDDILYSRGINYIPDFLCGAGEVIDVDCEGMNYSPDYVYNRVRKIYDKTNECIQRAIDSNKSTLKVSEEYVLNKIR